MRIKRLIASLMLILSLTQTVRADNECLPIIAACKVALAKHAQTEQDANTALQRQIAITAQVEQQRDSAEKSLGAWNHNFFYTTALGFAVGVLVLGYANRK